MDSSRVPSTRIRWAFAVSLALHLCVLTLLTSRTAGPSTTVTLERERFDGLYPVTRIVRRDLPARLTASRHSATAIAAAVPRRSPPKSRALPSAALPLPPLRQVPRAATRPPRRLAVAPVIPADTNRGLVQNRSGRGALRTLHAIAVEPVRDAAVTAQIAIVPRTPEPPTPYPTQTPTPAPSPSPSVSERQAAGNFSGLFSQNYSPALPAPTVVATIRSRLGGHGRIRIEVDESGHATGVQFSGPAAAGSQDLQDVRELLLGQTYVPADCNGLHCAGTLELTY